MALNHRIIEVYFDDAVVYWINLFFQRTKGNYSKGNT